MKNTLTFLIKKITNSDKFEVAEDQADGRVVLSVKADPSIIGLIIGKEGKTVKNLRKILSIQATQEKKAVNISVSEL